MATSQQIMWQKLNKICNFCSVSANLQA